MLHVAGEKDTLVKFEWQQRTMEELKKLNGCEGGQAWGKFATLYPSRKGTPVVTYVHPGDHKFPSDVPPVVVKFFKEQSK